MNAGLDRGAAGADMEGSLIGAARLDPTEAYGDVPGLLERTIKQDDGEAWELIKRKIDHLHGRLGHALRPVLREDDLEGRIRAEVAAGHKLFFKPNVVCALVLDYVGDGSPGLTTGVVAVTPWQFMAALLRYFHDELGVPYYKMAIGEAGVTMPMLSTFFGCAPEAILEGRIPRRGRLHALGRLSLLLRQEVPGGDHRAARRPR